MMGLSMGFLEVSIYSLLKDPKIRDVFVFFAYDSIKILVLLFVMIFAMAILRTYITREKIKQLLSERNGVFGNLVASIFGTLTPFCSCSSIPIFIGFIEAGAPLGVSSSFLITSPLVNEYVFVLMIGFFGFEVAAVYAVLGIVIGVLGGLAIAKLGMEKYLVQDIAIKKTKELAFNTFSKRVYYGFAEAKTILTKFWIWIIIGVGIGSIVHGYVPEELVNSIIESTGPFSIPLAVLIGVPIYANCSAIIPIAAALFEKGVPLGTALAFMMATAALSLPEAVILRRVMKLKLLLLFFGIVTLGIIIIGYLFNFLF